MLLTLPDGSRTFRLVTVDELTLNEQILCQKTTGLGPMQLEARLMANMTTMRAIAPLALACQNAADDDAAKTAITAYEQAVATADLDMFALGVHVWLSRRAAGERELTLEQACDFPIGKARQELEPDELAELGREQEAEARAAADPTSPGSVNGKLPGETNRQERRAAARKSTSTST